MGKAWRLSAGDEHTVFDENECKLVSVPCGGMSGRTFDEAAECAALIAAAPEMLEAVEKAAKVFRRYQALHRNKGTRDGEEKAEANRQLAVELEAVAAKARGAS